VLLHLILFLSTFFSVLHLLSAHRFKNEKILYNVPQRGISVIIPCYNEAPILKYTIEGVLNIEYSNMEVIFINDGSTDDTFEVLDNLLDLHIWNEKADISLSTKVREIYKSSKHPFIYVIDKYNSGKADSLNIGVAFARKEIIVTMDGDCVLEKSALANMNVIFDDEDVIAAGGVVHIMQMFKLNRRPSRIVVMQALDYIKGFYIYKASLAYNKALNIISGAFGAFRKSVIDEIGGFKKGLGEDIDITIRLQEYAQKNNKKVIYNTNSICYTECPETLIGLIRQRVRWQKGFMDAILNNSSFLIKNLLKNHVCFFMIVDALLSNSLATIVFIVNYILLLFKLFHGYPIHMFAYYVTTIVFNIMSSIIAITEAKKNVTDLKAIPLYLAIIYDLAFFQFLKVYFYLAGAIMYCFNNKKWYKVMRTNNCYRI